MDPRQTQGGRAGRTGQGRAGHCHETVKENTFQIKLSDWFPVLHMRSWSIGQLRVFSNIPETPKIKSMTNKAESMTEWLESMTKWLESMTKGLELMTGQ